MIILIESDKNKRKELGDLLPKERILTFGSTQDILEQIAKYKNEINIVIASLPYLYSIASDKNQTIQKLCDKLCIEIPPVIGYYGKKEEKHPIFKKALEKCKNYELVKYNKKDKEFPAKFIEAIRKEYRDLNVDLKKAKRIWSGEEEQFEDLSDIKKFIEEQGFIIEEPKEIYLEEIKEKHKKTIGEEKKEGKGKIEEKIIDIQESGLLLKEELKEEQKIEQVKGKSKEFRPDYKELYFSLKEQYGKMQKEYDELKNHTQDLIDTVKSSQ